MAETVKSSAYRPSDDDIINFENRIREEQVDVQPLISAPLPVTLLEEEYMSTNNPHFLSKIKDILMSYGVMRKTRGDGNCFFRAFSFGLVEGASRLPAEVRDPLIAKIQGLTSQLLQDAGFDRMAYEDFFEELVAIFADATHRADSDVSAWLAEEWQRNTHRSHSLVVLMRLVASAYLRTHADEYEPFIWEMGEANAPEGGMVQFCQKYVECLSVESDQIHIIALTKALFCDVEIAYLDGSDGPLDRLHFSSDEPSPISISLLYRPGHYDLLYPKPLLQPTQPAPQPL